MPEDDSINVFASLPNVTELDAIVVTASTKHETHYTAETLQLKTKTQLFDIAEGEFGLTIQYATKKDIIIQTILKAQQEN